MKKKIPNFLDLNEVDQEEYMSALHQSSSSLLLQVWQEVSKLFITYLQKSPTSPYVNVRSIFACQEYQKLRGNLHHIHLMLEVDNNNLSEEQKKFVNDLCRCSIFDIVRVNEIEKLINDGTFTDLDDYKSMQLDGSQFLAHKCNSACLVKTPNGKLRCRKLNNLKVSKDNTKHTYMDFDNNISKDCMDRLVQIKMIDPVETNENGYPKKNGEVNFRFFILKDIFHLQIQTMI